MTDCNEAIRPIHERMPVLLMPDEYDVWLNDSLDDLLAFEARCFPDDLIKMENRPALVSQEALRRAAGPTSGQIR